jgi:hypothetical protein
MSKFVKTNSNPNAMMGVPKLYKCCPGDYTEVCCDDLLEPKPPRLCSWLLFYDVFVDGDIFTSGAINYKETFVDLASFDSNWGGINGSLSLSSVYEIRFTLVSTSLTIDVNSLLATNILSPDYATTPASVPELTSLVVLDRSELDLTKTDFQFFITTSCGEMEVFSEFVAS